MVESSGTAPESDPVFVCFNDTSLFISHLCGLSTYF